jgi:tRNA A-37 threonylcarbamoyl transferase component Bud32
MKIMVKCAGKRKRIILEVEESWSIEKIKKIIQSQFLLPVISFRLLASVLPGFKIMLTDSFPLSFYNLSSSSIIEVDAFGYNSLKFKKRCYNSLYLPTLGLNINYTIIMDEVFEKVVEYCKTGNYFALFELALRDKQNNPDEDLLNRVHPNLWSPLHYACFYGHGKIAKYLIDNHVNVNKVTVDEWTALQLACFSNSHDCVSFLVQSKSLQINKITKFRGTGLHLACERQLTDIVKLLLDAKASVTIKDPSGKDPFEITPNVEIVEMLAKAAGENEIQKCVEVIPFIKCVWQYEPFYIHDRYIVLHLDIDEGYLSKYREIDDFHEKNRPDASIRLCDIQNVYEYSSRYTKKDCFYFEVETAKSTWRFYHDKKEIVKEWVERIQIAANYFCAHEEHYQNKRDSFKKSIVDNSEEKPNVVEPAPVEQPSEPSQVKNCVNFDSFELLEEIGEGGFGVVYMVRKKDDGKIYAMKSQNKKLLEKNQKLIYAVRECKIMKDLDHPFVISLHYAFQNKNYLYLVIDYCDGGDLSQFIKTYGRLDERTARFYLAETVLALEYLHTKGIVYRDLKPSNILLDSEGHIKMTDFGLAKENVNALNPAMSMAGTLAYLAPETWKQKGTTFASDIYGLGPLLYEMLTGERIFEGEDMMKIINNMQNLKINFPDHISFNAKKLIETVMNRDPLKRPTMTKLKNNSFFYKINFKMLLDKKMKRPMIQSKINHHHNSSVS